MIDASDLRIDVNVFYGCENLSNVTFTNIPIENVEDMWQYPWGIEDTSIIHGAAVWPAETVVTLRNGQTSSFNFSGELTRQKLINAGIFTSNGGFTSFSKEISVW